MTSCALLFAVIAAAAQAGPLPSCQSDTVLVLGSDQSFFVKGECIRRVELCLAGNQLIINGMDVSRGEYVARHQERPLTDEVRAPYLHLPEVRTAVDSGADIDEAIQRIRRREQTAVALVRSMVTSATNKENVVETVREALRSAQRADLVESLAWLDDRLLVKFHSYPTALGYPLGSPRDEPIYDASLEYRSICAYFAGSGAPAFVLFSRGGARIYLGGKSAQAALKQVREYIELGVDGPGPILDGFVREITGLCDE